MMQSSSQTLGNISVEWKQSIAPVDYVVAVETMETRVAAIAAGATAEMVWLLEHPPVYTAGTSARDEDLSEPARFPVHRPETSLDIAILSSVLAGMGLIRLFSFLLFD